MATNIFFRNYDNSMEQQLLESLIIESIRQYGEDMFYIPRKLNNYDPLFGEDDQSSYESSYLIEMYIKSVDGFEGDGTFLSKFGLEIRDRVTFTVARRVFDEEVGVNQEQLRPNEGDLIYFPLNKKCFQIKYVEKYQMFYPLGSLPTYDLQCELFEYSGETMNTGIEEIDSLQEKFSLNSMEYVLRTENGEILLDEDGNYIINESFMQEPMISDTEDNDTIQQDSTDILDFSSKDPFSETGVY
jgi:hypothetical protein